MSRVLVVEGDAACLRTMGLILRRENLAVVTVNNAMQALTELFSTPTSLIFELAIIDVQTSTTAGIDLVQKIYQAKLSLPILAISGFFDQQMVEGLSAYGCTDFLRKPFNDEEFVQRVFAIIKK